MSCREDGYDFAYTTVEDHGMISALCGSGPGTPCQGDSSRCEGANLITCMYGKEGATQCREFCREVGDIITYDGGRCTTERDQGVCVCCDAGEPGCETEKPRPPSRGPRPRPGIRLARP